MLRLLADYTAAVTRQKIFPFGNCFSRSTVAKGLRECNLTATVPMPTYLKLKEVRCAMQKIAHV
jgi:hypothetical protein